ncbi:hypothetical protein DICVIV_04890 [Dictyocaulus viviparus]|uniref:Uncharacterized protein n=1 Tax=Dictyocaulus viviparus TaxID=29172 RepID=A0A0D8Y341_DICVI|nr:hypothetical protein DICVIV_04890 [Dictyocaulus viviparus]
MPSLDCFRCPFPITQTALSGSTQLVIIIVHGLNWRMGTVISQFGFNQPFLLALIGLLWQREKLHLSLLIDIHLADNDELSKIFCS